MDAGLDARIDTGTAADTTLAAAWPLFALRIRTERLDLRLPTDDDLLHLMDLARSGIHPPGEMPFGVPWSTLESPGFERGFLAHHWGNRASWEPGSWELDLAASLDGTLIGMQGMSARRFSATRTVHTGSWLGRSFQGTGFGKEMRGAVLALAFDGLGAQFAETEAFLDNAASNAVSRALGYADNGFGSLAPEGVPRETRRFRLTYEGWRSGARSPVEIEGLTGCEELFGAWAPGLPRWTPATMNDVRVGHVMAERRRPTMRNVPSVHDMSPIGRIWAS